MKLLRALILASCIAVPVLPTTALAQSADAFRSVKDVMELVTSIRAGDTRASIEANFRPDGGFQARMSTRYIFKKCDCIKIDVDFSGDRSLSPTDLAPSDTVVHVSKPYLEYPFAD
jgi:hypothetical protein